MHYNFYPYLWISISLLIILSFLLNFAWKRRAEKGVPYFFLTLVLAALWVFSQAMEIAAADLSTKLIWANIMYIPSTLTPVTYFFLALFFLGQEKWLKNRWLPILLLIMPLLLNALLWTNGYHGLVRQNIYLDTSGSFPVIGKTYGPFFWIYSTYNIILTLFTLTILLKETIECKDKLRRAQVTSLFLGLLIPMCSVCVYISRIFPLKVDPTPLAIGFSSLVIFWGIFRYRLFDIVRIAHSMVIHEMSTGLVILDNEGGVLEVNPAATEMLDIPRKKPAVGSIYTLLDRFPQLINLYNGKTDRSEEAVFANGENTNYYEISLKKLENSGSTPLGWIIQIYNITKRKVEEDRIRHIATHDTLTGLMNRGYFQKVFSEELTHARMNGSNFSLAYMDLDDFKLINDTYGHEAGDEYLREVAERLIRVLRNTDIISRYGGDEYAILFPSVGDDEILEFITRKLFNAFEADFSYNGLDIPIKASVGFSVYPRDGLNLETLIDKADKAMYSIKTAQKNNACIYKEPVTPAGHSHTEGNS